MQSQWMSQMAEYELFLHPWQVSMRCAINRFCSRLNIAEDNLSSY